MVAAPFRRIEEDAEPALVIPPRSLQTSSFLVGNPGIQGSNLVCRLSVLLEAGLFDESLPSCTDRDLCIRIAELPGVGYGTTAHPTVHHFACQSRPRLSTCGSPSRLGGLDGFFRKYRGRMTEAERARFRARARRLFGWEESPTEPIIALPAQRASTAPARRHCDPSQDRPHLIAGMIADTDRLEEVGGLLADLQGLAGDPGLSGLDVLVLENGLGRRADDDLRALVAHERARGLRIHLVDRPHHLEDAARGLVLDGGARRGRKLPIACARTALQTYLYAFAKRRPGAVVWIVDDDMRLDPLVAGRDGQLHRRPLDLVPMLRGLMDDTERWWTDDTWRTPVGRLRTFADRLAACYEPETLKRIEREARALDVRHICEFLEQLPVEIEAHRRRLADISPLTRGLEAERVANAKAVAARLAAPAGALTVLGCGAEAVALTDGTHVFKVFDYWKTLHSESAAAFLRSLVGAWTDARCLYPLLDFRESGHHAVLVYAFEASEPFTGGHGPGMVELLAECRRYGIVCRNSTRTTFGWSMDACGSSTTAPTSAGWRASTSTR